MTESCGYKAALSIAETADALSISRPKVYELTRRADFPCFKLGNRTLVSRSGLEAWVEQQTREART